MTTVYLSPIGNDAPFYKGGFQLEGGQLFTYEAGTTTLQTTYSANPGSVGNQNANPLITNSEGYCAASGNRVPIWLNGELYKFVLKDANDVTLWTIDDVSGINNFTATGTEWIDVANGALPTYVSATSFTLPGDLTGDALAERWVKTTNAGGTAYSIVVSSSYSSPNTTITVANTSGVLDSGISAAQWGLLRPDHPSVPMDVTNVKASNLATAASTNIWTTNGNYIHLTGGVTITSLGTAPYAGARRRLVFDSATTLTHNALTLVCPGGTNMTFAAGDMVDVVADTTTKIMVSLPAASMTLLPAGSIIDFAGSTAPSGYLECDGSSLLNTASPALYAAISTTWGSVDGTHFSLPDFRSRGRIGRGTGTKVETVTSVTAAANAIAVASNSTKWITGQVVVLSGVTGFSGITNGTYYVIRTDSTHVKFASSLASAQNVSPLTVTGTGSLVMTHTFTARTIGEVGGEETHAMTISELLSHSHPLPTTTGGPLAAGILPEADPSGTNAYSSEAAGGNAAMNIMQPFAVSMTIIKT